MRYSAIILIPLLSVFLFVGTLQAHYGMIIPSDQMITQGDKTTISLDLRFWHPMTGIPMSLDKPVRFQVVTQGRTEDLLESLKPVMVKGHRTWQTQYRVKRPGLYVFTMEPQPYWEAAEDKYIIHYTKVVVTAFGNDLGWDKPVGLKTEIVPLAKPYGLYTGNVFQGTVLLDGKPVPNAEVEVEFYNEDGTFKAPNDYMITQTIKADVNGVFTYAAPREGWWGFAALNPGDTPIRREGKDKEVELGAILWVRFVDMK